MRRLMNKRCTTLLSMCLFYSSLSWGVTAQVINPITDVCWKCLFPIHIAGANVTPQYKDSLPHGKSLCYCSGLPPKAGVPLSFWEPANLIEVTRTPYKLSALGGVSISKGDIRKKGAVSHVGESGKTSFYNVHYYTFPVLSWLDFLSDFSCLESGSMELAYMSEFDPFWNDDEWSYIVQPEAALFATQAAHLSCIADCSAASLDKSLDKLFWCAGCSGSLYPFIGHIPHHLGGIQGSYLVLQRLLAKLHSMGMMWGYKKDAYCEKTAFPRLVKSQYKTQLVFPNTSPQSTCHALGKSDLIWGSLRSYPYKGEDFVYLLWRRKHCCLDAVKPALKTLAEGAL